MKTFIAIIIGLLLTVVFIYFWNGCRSQKSDPRDKQIDSLTHQLTTITLQGEARYKLYASVNHNLTVALDTTTKALAFANKKLNARDKQILASNKELHAAIIIHDTPTVYRTAEYLSYQIDSMQQEKWNVDRELDRQIVLNEQRHYNDSTELAKTREDLKSTRKAASELLANEEEQRRKEVKKAKRGRGFFAFVGVLLGGGIRSFIK